MKNLIYILLNVLAICWIIQAKAQTVGATELTATPPALKTLAPVSKTTEKTAKPTSSETPFSGKPQLSLTVGTQFSSFWGTSAYVQPRFLIPITPRLISFASLTLVNSFGPSFLRSNSENPISNNNAFGSQQYILQVGGHYLVSERLQLTGSAWKDLSRTSAFPSNRVNLLFPNSGSGFSFRANYKVTENISVSGGLRYSNGNTGYNQFNNTFYPGANSPFTF